MGGIEHLFTYEHAIIFACMNLEGFVSLKRRGFLWKVAESNDVNVFKT